MNFVKQLIATGGLLLLAFSAGAQTCAPEEMTDVRAFYFELAWTPTSPFGTSMFDMRFMNDGPNATTRTTHFSLYELDDNLERSRIIRAMGTGSGVPSGLGAGGGGYDNSIVQGKIYEFVLLYECDTNLDNNSLFRMAYTLYPDHVIFMDGMEGAPLPSATAAQEDHSSK